MSVEDFIWGVWGLSGGLGGGGVGDVGLLDDWVLRCAVDRVLLGAGWWVFDSGRGLQDLLIADSRCCFLLFPGCGIRSEGLA